MTKPDHVGGTRAVIIVCDGLRRDLIGPATTPFLARFGQSAAVFGNARSVFPSLTRVSAASLATGCHPNHHGLLGNTMVLNGARGLECHSAGHPEFRDRLRSVTGRTLWRPALADYVQSSGGAVALSNVSPGGAYFLDPDNHGHVYHRAGSYSPGGRRISGAAALEIDSGAAGDLVMTARFCDDVLRRQQPALAILWLSEPDWTGHQTPLGSPEYRAALHTGDRCVGEVVAAIDALDPGGDRILRVLCSDHGAVTVSRTIDVASALIDAELKDAPSSNDVVVAPNGTAALIYVDRLHRSRIAAIADFLRTQDWVGDVFAGDALAGINLPGDTDLAVAVTLQTDSQPNVHGVVGHGAMAFDPDDPVDYGGHGMHGGLGFGEQQPFLFIAGRDFPPGSRGDAVSLVDIAPTVLQHLGLPAGGMDGRPLQRSRA